MSVEQAVHRMTGELAEWYQIDAGHLRVGDRADLVVVNPAHLDSRLDDYAAEGAFDRLVVCAAPQTLGDLRNKLSEKTRTQTTAEIDKNFSNLPTDKLISSVRSIMFDA